VSADDTDDKSNKDRRASKSNGTQTVGENVTSHGVGDIEPARVVVQGPPSVTRFAVRATAEVRTFGGLTLRERVLLELPEGRAPPQGAILALRARPVVPRGPETGFDERGWLARRGIHVVLHASGRWRVVGRRGGIGGVGDRLRTEIAAALALGTSGERRVLVTGVVLGPTRASILRCAMRSRLRGSTTCSPSRARTSC
jgi:hypothetical protein